jgi:hypothetical protein
MPHPRAMAMAAVMRKLIIVNLAKRLSFGIKNRFILLVIMNHL